MKRCVLDKRCVNRQTFQLISPCKTLLLKVEGFATELIFFVFFAYLLEIAKTKNMF